MIVYELACICGFTFEGWFQDRDDFESQQTASFLVCPECGCREIKKILSPIRFKSSCNDSGTILPGTMTGTNSLDNPEKPLEALQKFVEENFEDVGSDLAKESLKIHYGVSEPRNIRGITTESEEKKLQEEGINLIKVPVRIKNKTLN